jgi:YHS domain-containing protein
MISQKDVTAEVKAQGQQAVLKAAREAQPELEHQVIALYQGGMYQLYSHKIYDDLRLVCVPHGQSAHFGGDPDNFCYPRWGLDFAFLRAYEDGKPVDSKEHCFTWKTEGASEDEAVFVIGNPGSTGRLKTLAQCEFDRDQLLPRVVARYEGQLAQFEQQVAGDEEKRKKLLPQILRAENGRKALQGYLDGLRDERIMKIKAKAEADLRAEIAKKPELQEAYGDIWDRIAGIQAQRIQAMQAGDNAKMQALQQEENDLNVKIGEACFAAYGTEIPPDATMSLRISDGVVKGYDYNGTKAPHITTLYGLFARYHEFGGEHPFDIPKEWLDKEKELDLSTPFNFVATCDIIGGNSGSPMIDKDQNVVGLIFDGNIEMLGNRYVFDDEISRTVSVHTAIIVESLRKIYGAGALADELERKAGAMNEKCPVSGMAVDASHFVVHEGRQVAFCCAKCKAKFEQDPAKFASKLKGAAGGK